MSNRNSINQDELKKLRTKPLVQYSDMPTEMGGEAVEIITMAVDKFQAKKNYEGAAQLIKNTMDKKFGSTWHCAIGEGFGFDVTCQRKFLLHIHYGVAAILCYKS
eukprot:scaffold2753_cov238-Chaetoceros_neogracile.AAC.1